jgi:hypothetical protein
LTFTQSAIMAFLPCVWMRKPYAKRGAGVTRKPVEACLRRARQGRMRPSGGGDQAAASARGEREWPMKA